MAELDRLGLGAWTRGHTVNDGLRAHGFGQVLELPWPGGSLPAHGSAVARTELDHRLRDLAIEAGAHALPPAKAVDVVRTGERVRGVVFAADGERREVRCDRLVVADGVRSPLGRVLGRQWHRDTVYGVAARATSTPAGRTAGSPPTWSFAEPTGSCCPATAGSSRSAAGR